MSTIQFKDDIVKQDRLPRESHSRRKGKTVNHSRLTRVRSLSVSRIPNDIIEDGDRARMSSRRVRLSDDVLPVSRSYAVLAVRRTDKARETVHASQFARYDLLKEKCSLSRNLRSLSNVLCACLSSSEKNFKISKTKNGYQIYKTKGKLNSESVICLLQIIRRAVDLDVKGVFTDHGRWLSMSDFLDKIKSLFEKNRAFRELMDDRNYELLEKTIAHFTKEEEKETTRRSLKSLKLPDFATKLPKKEQTIVSLLQRIYPGGSKSKGYIDPVTLILVYPRYVTTQRFFELVKLLMIEPEKRMPTVQKQRLLNLCRTWVSRKYHPDQIKAAKILTRIHNVINLGMLSEDPMQVDLSHDLSSHMTSAPLHVREYRMVDGEVSLQEVLDRLTKGNLHESAEMIAADCYEMSRATILNIPLYELLLASKETVFIKQLVDSFEQLSNFVRVTVLQPVCQLNPVQAMPFIQLRIKLWIEVADRLLQQGEFSLALAVVSGLSNSAISRLGSKEKGEKNFPKKTMKKWEQLNEIFSPIGDFREMKAMINSRQEEGGSCVPYLGLFTRYLTHSADGNKEEIGGVINVEKLHIIAGILSSFWKDLANLRSKARKGGTVVHFQTNLKACLQGTEMWKDEQLWKLSAKIKPFKTA